MKITKARLKKAIKEAMEGVVADPQLDEFIGPWSKKAKAKKAAKAKSLADTIADVDAKREAWKAKHAAADAARAARAAARAEEEEREERRIAQDEREWAARRKGREKAGSSAGADAAYKECQQSVARAVNAGQYGTHGNPSEADEARNRCSERYRMAMKNVRESQSKEGKAKITKSQLKKVIQEEMEKILAEA